MPAPAPGAQRLRPLRIRQVAFEEFHLYLHPINQYVGGDTVMKPTVVRDNHRAAGEPVQQGVFQRAGLDIQSRSSVRRAAGRCRPPADSFRCKRPRSPFIARQRAALIDALKLKRPT